MAIPFYEAALTQRLPVTISSAMGSLDSTKAWLGDTTTCKVFKAGSFTGSRGSLCLLPDSVSASKWKEYVLTGTVTDKTAPPAPYDLSFAQAGDSLIIRWKADADIESGIKYFRILENGTYIGRVPGNGSFQTFDTNGDNAIPKMVPEMKFSMKNENSDRKVISVSTVNQFDLESPATEISILKKQ
jgi:hypothetical protein